MSSPVRQCLNIAILTHLFPWSVSSLCWFCIVVQLNWIKHVHAMTFKDSFICTTWNSQSCLMEFCLLALQSMGVTSVVQWIMKYIQSRRELARSDINTPKAALSYIKHSECHPWVLILLLSWVRIHMFELLITLSSSFPFLWLDPPVCWFGFLDRLRRSS